VGGRQRRRLDHCPGDDQRLIITSGLPAARVTAQDGRMAGDARLDEVADELYTLPPEQFVAARDQHTRAARATGDRGLATAVAALRRPTTSAWVLNLLVRDQPALLDQLLGLGADLRAAQRELRGPELRELATQRQRVVAELVRAARRRAAEAGHPVGTDTGYEVEQTLHAALADPDVARQVATGRLVKPITVTGFDAEAVALTGPTRSTGSPARTTPAAGDPAAGDPAAADPAAGNPHGEKTAAGTDDKAGTGDKGGTDRKEPAGEPPKRNAAELRRAERERAERERAEQEDARRRAEHDRLVAARESAQADVEATDAELADAKARLTAAEQARADAEALVESLEEQLNAARRAYRDSGGQIRDAERRRTEAARGRDAAARRLADLTARLDAHRR
jgi:hypothetical protein